MSSVKALAIELKDLPAEEAQAKLEAFVGTLVEEIRTALDSKDPAEQFKTGAFHVRATEERWKGLAHRLAGTELAACATPDRFRIAARAALPKVLTDAAFAPLRSPAQLKAERDAEAAKAKAAARKGKDRPAKKKPAPRPQANPTITVKTAGRVRETA